MHLEINLIGFLGFFIYFVSAREQEYEASVEGTVISVQHSLTADNDDFVDRGTISLRSLTSATYIEGDELTEQHLDQLMALAFNNGFYRVRLVLQNSEGVNETVQSACLACAFLESGLTDTISIHLDSQGHLMGTSVVPTVSACSQDIARPEGLIRSSVEVQSITTGPSPETQVYLEKIERERAMKQKDAQGENKSFFAKYWMYIIPAIVILVAMQGQADPQGGGGR